MPKVFDLSSLNDAAFHNLASDARQIPLHLKRLERDDALFRSAFELMEEEFHPDALDPRSRLALWLKETATGIHEFPFLMTAAVLSGQENDYVGGTFDGNLMELRDWSRVDPLTLKAPATSEKACVFVVGRQATSKHLRTQVKGIGTRLFKYSVEQATLQAHALGKKLKYVVLESEPESVGFWKKQGFVAPTDGKYLQPSLEFDPRTGLPLRGTRPEVLMFLPVLADAKNTSLPRQDFINTVATIYTYWSLHPFRQEIQGKLEKLRKEQEQLIRAQFTAENAVLRDLIDKVTGALPEANELGWE